MWFIHPDDALLLEKTFIHCDAGMITHPKARGPIIQYPECCVHDTDCEKFKHNGKKEKVK